MELWAGNNINKLISLLDRHLFFLRPGNMIEFNGPTYFPKLRYAENGLKLYPSNMIMIAGGSGVSPMLHLIKDVFRRGIDCKMILIWGVRVSNSSDTLMLFIESSRSYLSSISGYFSDRTSWPLSSGLLCWCNFRGDTCRASSCRRDWYFASQVSSSLLTVLTCFRESLVSFPPTEQDMNIIICGPPKMSVATMASLGTLGYSSDKIFSYNS